MAEFEKMDLASVDLVAERIEQLKQLLPEVATESGIDFDKLRLVLGDEVDEGTERYAFTWPGKSDAIRQSQTPSTATLRPCPEESVNWDETENLYIEGDNLEVLKLLQHSYHGRVKLIYIDPPYNTGHDFVYKDKFGDTIENYREQAGLIGQSNPSTSGRFHSDWLSMMYPRLRLARELLADQGAIFISIDDSECFGLKTICDEIFGANNFVTDIIWEKSDSPKNDTQTFSVKHDHILLYAKNIEQLEIKRIHVEEVADHYNKVDSDGRRYYLKPLRAMGKNDAREARPNLYYALTAPDGTEVYPVRTDGTDGNWRWSRQKVEEQFDRIEWTHSSNGWSPNYRIYADEQMERPPETIWYHKDVGSNRTSMIQLKNLLDGDKTFTTPKPTGLIQRMMEIISDDDSIVMDFFSGSGTTADAVLQFNCERGGARHFILVQIPEIVSGRTVSSDSQYATITQLGKERIRRAGAKIAADVEESNKQLRFGEEPKPVPDIGFRVLKLDESGIERPKPGELLLDVVKPDRSDEDIIFEMMLKWGLELTLPIEKVSAAGYPCYSVAYGELVCCLADGLNMQVLDAIADMEPRRVLMLDRILDDTTKLNAVQAFKRVEEKTGREVELRTV